MREVKTAKGVKTSDLANELKMTTAELITTLNDLGVMTDGPSSMIDEATVATVKEMLQEASAEKVAEVPANPTVREVAESLGLSPNLLVKKLMEMGQLIAANQRINMALAEKLALGFGYKLKIKAEAKPEPKPLAIKHKGPAGATQPRPPVVTIMGHVDHGKTSLLDSIRKAKVADGEFGGITQHIGAYQVEVEHNGEKRKITFLDTPGHEAFTEMRARGAQVTDIVILVVAADDGIMPQTIEAIHHAQAAEVPMIVAINKIDKPDARPDRIKQQLTEHNVLVEEYGGDVITVPVSAKTGEGIPELLEYLLLVADVQEFQADPHGHATGAVVEASIETGRGAIATLLVQSGTLRVGDIVVAGLSFGKVRAMMNERGERVLKAGPSTPVEVQGLNSSPAAGDSVEVVKTEKEARQITEKRIEKERNVRMSGGVRRLTLDDLSRQAQEGLIKDLNIILKGDVQGSVEAVLGQLKKINEADPDNEVRITVKLSGVGLINESDISLAVATGAIVIGFNVRPDVSAQRAAERDGVDVRTYNIIYKLTEDIERAMRGLLTPVYEEVILGSAKVLQRFQTSKGQVIAGCSVQDGKLQRGAEARIIRGNTTLYTSRIESLRRMKDDVREVLQGFECGIVMENWSDVQPDDIFQCFEMRQVERL